MGMSKEGSRVDCPFTLEARGEKRETRNEKPETRNKNKGVCGTFDYLDTHHTLFTNVHYSLFTANCSQFTTHCSLIT